MTWNYRILKLDNEFGIHEVFYDESNKPISFTVQKVSPRGETLDDFHSDFGRYEEALSKSVLVVTDDEKLVELDEAK